MSENMKKLEDWASAFPPVMGIVGYWINGMNTGIALGLIGLVIYGTIKAIAFASKKGVF